MYLDERSNKLLKEVLANPDTSNVQLEKKYRLTRRQVSYSFQKINEWLKGNNYPAINRTNGGKFVISPIIMELFAPSDTSAHKKYIASETERAQLISLLLMSGEAELSLIHFTSLLDVSKNTILRDLKNVQKLVDPFQVKVSYSRTNGYELLGSEWNIRKALLEVLTFILSMYNGKALIEEYMGIADQELEGIKKQMEEVERTLNSRFIDERMEILPYIIAAIFKRIRNGKMIEENGQIDYDSLSDTKEYKATEILIKDGCILPKSERLFITIQLLTSKIVSSSLLTDEKLPKLAAALASSLDRFEKNACIVLKDKEKLLNKLLLHMKPAYYRIKHQLTMEYELIEKVKNEFDALHFIVKDSFYPLEDFIGSDIAEGEWMFITVLIGGYLISSGENIQYKKRAIVLCPNGVSISKLMESTLKDLFPEFYFYHALSIREFHQLKLEPDIIFSPVPVQTNKRLFIVERFLTDYEKVQLRQRVLKEIYGLNANIIDIDQLLSTIEQFATIKERDQLKHALQEQITAVGFKEKVTERSVQAPSLASILTENMIVVKKNISSWQEAIQAASKPLLDSGKITSDYVEEMIKQYPTLKPHIVLRNVIALPHASPEFGVNEFGMSLLKLEEGLDFQEGNIVHFIIVLAATDKSKHLTALRQLIKISQNKEEVLHWRSCNTAGELYQAIQRYG